MRSLRAHDCRHAIAPPRARPSDRVQRPFDTADVRPVPLVQMSDPQLVDQRPAGRVIVSAVRSAIRASSCGPKWRM
jgi:hypothetical protein